MPLNTAANLVDPDGFYEELIEAQRGMDDESAIQMNCKLLILLANHIGDRAVLSEAIALACGAQAPFARR